MIWDTFGFGALCLAILIVPGPTNVLFAIVATNAGWRPALRLIPVAVAAYLAVVMPLALFGQTLLADAPLATRVVQAAAAIWVAWLALSLWRARAASPEARRAGVAVLALTTALNPKGLLFGLAILPGADHLPLWLVTAVFVSCIALSAAVWALAGGMLRGRHEARVRRMSALGVGALAGMLAFGALSGAG